MSDRCGYLVNVGVVGDLDAVGVVGRIRPVGMVPVHVAMLVDAEDHEPLVSAGIGVREGELVAGMHRRAQPLRYLAVLESINYQLGIRDDGRRSARRKFVAAPAS